MANWAAISSVDDMFNPMFGGKLRPFYKGYELQRVLLQRVLITKGIGNKGYQQQKVSFASAVILAFLMQFKHVTCLFGLEFDAKGI